MLSVRVIFGSIFILFMFSLLYFWGIFNKTIIPFALVGYKMIIANSYPMRARGIIVKYNNNLISSANIKGLVSHLQLASVFSILKYNKLFIKTALSLCLTVDSKALHILIGFFEIGQLGFTLNEMSCRCANCIFFYLIVTHLPAISRC